MDQTMDHILVCTDELFQAGDIGTPGTTSPEANLSKKPTTSNGNQPKRRNRNARDDGEWRG